MSVLGDLQKEKKRSILQQNEDQLEELKNEKANEDENTKPIGNSSSKPRRPEVKNKKLFKVKKPQLKLRSLYLPQDLIFSMEEIAKKNNISFNEVGRSIISDFFDPSH